MHLSEVKWFTKSNYLLSRDQQDLMLCLLQALLRTRDLYLITEVIRTWDLDFGGCLELQFLKLLPVFADDKTMVFLGDGNRRWSLSELKNKYIKLAPPSSNINIHTDALKKDTSLLTWVCSRDTISLRAFITASNFPETMMDRPWSFAKESSRWAPVFCMMSTQTFAWSPSPNWLISLYFRSSSGTWKT